VIRENGSFTGYRWGPERKSVLIARELAQLSTENVGDEALTA
jgi:hypothetical protein